MAPPNNSKADGAKKNAEGPKKQLAAKQPPPSLCQPHTKLVTVHIKNPEGEVTDFVVHKSFLCHAASFFDRAFNGNFIEGETQSMVLETSREAFGMLVDFAYSGCTRFCHEVEGGINRVYNRSCCPDGKNQWKAHYGHLIELWVLAGYVGMPKLQNLAGEQIYNCSFERICLLGKSCPSTHFYFIYANTSEYSPLRALILQIFVSTYFKSHEIDDVLSDTPKEMLHDAWKRKLYGGNGDLDLKHDFKDSVYTVSEEVSPSR